MSVAAVTLRHARKKRGKMATDTGNMEVDGLVEQKAALERLMMGNPDMEKRVQKLIRKVLMEVRNHLGNEAKVAMKSDPRQAYRAVKRAVYRQILGGSVSILDKRRWGVKFSSYEPPRKLLQGQRGGNRLPRSERTNDLIHYAGSDRGFILRFINAGTVQRTTRYGNRGKILARNFFGQHSKAEMEQAAENLSRLIDEMVKNELR